MINETGIGPAGYGGRQQLFSLNIETFLHILQECQSLLVFVVMSHVIRSFIMIYLETPLTVDKIKQLKAGDEVFKLGTIYTGRDAAHKD